MTQLYLYHADEALICECADCDHKCRFDEVDPISDFEERVSPGEICPHGQCPECGALMYAEEKDEDNRDRLDTLARALIKKIDGDSK